MLRELRIRNFVLIKDLTIEFARGFNVLTGETGAGKSIIIDALGLLLGDRANVELIRLGEEEAIVEAVFDGFDKRTAKRLHKILDESGLEEDPGGLFIKRTIRRESRGRCYVNSSPTPLKVLESIGDVLVDVHGQHEHQSLLRSDVHIALLDAYADMEEKTSELRAKYSHMREIDVEIARLEEARRERNRQEDHLQYQIEEIEKAEIVADEEEPLQAERRRLQHSGRLMENAQVIQTLLLEGEDEKVAVVDSLAEVQRRLQEMAEVDESLAGLARDIGAALIQVEETGREAASYGQNIENDPQRLEEIEQRLHLLKNLKTKYGATLEEVLSYLDQTRTRLQELRSADESLEELTEQKKQVAREFIEMALEVSHERQKAAVRLSRAVTRELRELGMEHGQFLAQVEALHDSGQPLEVEGKNYRASSRGIDRVEFLVTTNPGQPAGPIRQVASGGELSRIALGIKSVLAAVDRVGTLVFDEVDSGVGGDIAEVVGAKFRQVADERQILCITHLPQIAGKAHRNFRVSKVVVDDQTHTEVDAVEGERLETEIARMLGNEESDESLQYARRLIHQG